MDTKVQDPSDLLVPTSEKIDTLVDLIKHAERTGLTITSAMVSKSLAGKKKAATKTDDDSALDAIMTGDIIVLTSLDESTPGLLVGDRALQRCGVQEKNGREAFNSDMCAFRVLPMLKYRQRNELAAHEKEQDELEAARAHGGVGGGDEDDGEETDEEAALENDRLLRQRVDAEAANNARFVGEIAQGHHKEMVRYGMPVQLQHVKSGLMLTAEQSSAPVDPECRRIALRPGAGNSVFKLMPRFKAQTEGSIVYYGVSMVVESMAQRENFVHVSTAVYDELPHWSKPQLPRCLRTGRSFECNLSPAFSTFKCSRMGRFTPEETAQYLPTSLQPFRLYHSQAGAFVTASCDTEKGRGHPGRSWVSRTGEEERLLPLHAPYLKVLDSGGGDSEAASEGAGGGGAAAGVSTLEPTDPSCQTSKSLWAVEALSRSTLHPVEWDQPVRIRHVGSGKYLCVDPTPLQTLRSDGVEETLWSTRLVDDALIGGAPQPSAAAAVTRDVSGSWDDAASAREGSTYGAGGGGAVEGDHLLELADPSCLVFNLTAADATDAVFVPRSDVGVWVEHRVKDPRSSSGQVRTVYLHNSEDPKPRRAELGPRDPTAAVGSFQLVFTSSKSVQDTFKMMLCDSVEVDQLDLVKSYLAPVHLYSYALRDPNAYKSVRAMAADALRDGQQQQQQLVDVDGGGGGDAQGSGSSGSGATEKDYKPITKLFLDLIALQVQGSGDKAAADGGGGDSSGGGGGGASAGGGGGAGGGDEGAQGGEGGSGGGLTDWVKIANKSLPAAFSKLFGGIPDKPFQALSRDLKLMDAVFEATLAAYTHTYPNHPFSDPQYEAEMAGPKAVQKFCHVVLQRMLAGCSPSQSYFGRRQLRVALMEPPAGTGHGGEDDDEEEGEFGAPKVRKRLTWMESVLREKDKKKKKKKAASSLDMGSRFGGGGKQLQSPTPAEAEAAAVFEEALSLQSSRPTWMSVLVGQVEDPLGAAVTLSNLLASDEALMAKYATPDLVERFVDMIGRLGPQPRLIGFFSAVCSVNGLAIKANQEMLLRLTWMNPLVRSRVHIEFKAVPTAVLTPPGVEFGPLPDSNTTTPSTDPSSSTTSNNGRFTAAQVAAFPDTFIGKASAESPAQLPPVYVTWHGGLDWKGGDSFFFPDDELGYPSCGQVSVPDPSPPEDAQWSPRMLVRVERFLWVLEPHRLCEAVTGMPWPAVQQEMASDPSKEELFSRQVQVAGYFTTQVELLALMCAGRSSNVTAWLEKSFSYELLVSLLRNPYLPPTFRGAVAQFLHSLYVDRYPQLANCGRPCLPEQLWLYELGKGDEDVGGGEGGGTEGLPLVRPGLKLGDEVAMPAFGLAAEHPLRSDPNEMLGFPSHTKFYLLREFCNGYLERLGGVLVHDDTATNTLTERVVQVLQALLTYGFQSTVAKVEALVPLVVGLLDGRCNMESRELPALGGGAGSEAGSRVASPGRRPPTSRGTSQASGLGLSSPLARPRPGGGLARGKTQKSMLKLTMQAPGGGQGLVPFMPLQKRYAVSVNSGLVTSTKVAAIAVLRDVASLRANFRLAKLLERFKELCDSGAGHRELVAHHKALRAGAGGGEGGGGSEYSGWLTQDLFDKFEALFEEGDGARLDMEPLSKGADVNAVLLDCLMYDDDALFSASLALLEANFTQRRDLVESAKKVVLLTRASVPVFGSVAKLNAELSYLGALVRSYEVWGVNSRVSGPFGHDKFDALREAVRKCKHLLVSKPFPSDMRTPREKEAVEVLKAQATTDKANAASGGAGGDEAKPNKKKKPKAKKKKEFKIGGPGFGETKRDDGDAAAGGGEDVLDLEEGHPEKRHQDVLRACNLQGVLYEGLRLDYNLAFKGSICTPEEKVESRRMLVGSQREVMELASQFVRGNADNQSLVFAHLPLLRPLMGPLAVPSWQALEGFPPSCLEEVQHGHGPGLNAEKVVIECLRGNASLCGTAVDQSLLDRFAELLNGCADPSESPLLEFFALLCQPRGPESVLENQQVAVAKLLLGRRFRAVWACVNASFGVPKSFFGDLSASERAGEKEEEEAEALCAAPEGIVGLFVKATAFKNVAVANLLASRGVTIDRLLTRLEGRAEELGDRRQPHADPLTVSLCRLLSHLMAVLVIDPRLYRRAATWGLVVHTGRKVLAHCAARPDYTLGEAADGGGGSGAGDEDEAGGGSGSGGRPPLYYCCAALLSVTAQVVSGARALGVGEKEKVYRAELKGKKGFVGSIADSALAIHFSRNEALLLSKAAAAGEGASAVLMGEGDGTGASPGLDEWSSGPSSSSPSAGVDELNDLCVAVLEILNPKAIAAEKRRRLEQATQLDSNLFGIGSKRKGGGGSMAMSMRASSRGSAGGGAGGGGFLSLRGSVDTGGGSLSEERTPRSTEELLTFFTEALETNELLMNKITKRRFALVEVLENAAKFTDPLKWQTSVQQQPDALASSSATPAQANPPSNGGATEPSAAVQSLEKDGDDDDDEEEAAEAAKSSGKGSSLSGVSSPRRSLLGGSKPSSDAPPPASSSSGAAAAAAAAAAGDSLTSKYPCAVQVTWEGLVDRMVKFVRAHNYDRDEANLIRIFGVLSNHLIKARADAQGQLYDMQEIRNAEVRARELAKLARLQEGLDARGVTKAALVAIATHPLAEGNSADAASKLLLELIRYGNDCVQDTVLEHMKTADKDGFVLLYLKQRLTACVKDVKERLDATAGAYQPLTPLTRKLFAGAKDTLELVWFFCEGHHTGMQNFVREQPGRAVSVDLVSLVAAVVQALGDTSVGLRRMEDAEVDLLGYALTCLVELVQGPCPQSQLLVSKHTGVLNALDKILLSPFHPRVDTALVVEAKGKALNMLAALLEGREDVVVHRRLASEVPPHSFEACRTHLGAIAHATTSWGAFIGGEGGEDDDGEDIRDAVVEALVFLDNVYVQLQLLPDFRRDLEGLLEKRKKEKGADLLDTQVARVEVAWGESRRVESVSFRLPKQAPYLSQGTKARHLASVELATAEKRMKLTFAQCPVFVAEMERIYELASWSLVYSTVGQNIALLKRLVYAVAVALNVNVLMATFGDNTKAKGYGYYNTVRTAQEEENLGGSKALSVYSTLALALLNLAGYVVITLFHGVTEVPIAIQRTDAFVKEALAAGGGKQQAQAQQPRRNPGAFARWYVGAAFVGLFVAMHACNYVLGSGRSLSSAQLNLYLTLVLIGLLPWLVACARSFVVVPDTPSTRAFAIAYDVCVSQAFLRNHVLLMACNVLGCFRNEFFSLLLLDIANNSDVLSRVVSCITLPAQALLSVLYVFAVTAVVFAQFGLKHFEHAFSPTPCHSASSCFWLLMYKAMPRGMLTTVLEEEDNSGMEGDPDYLLRILFDTLFFIWVGILLFNIVTGLLIDTFVRLNTAGAARSDTLSNEGFVNGLTRVQFDDLGLPHAPKFEDLNEKSQHVWNYVYFWYYLANKRVLDMTGAEEYVSACLAKGDTQWLPYRTSFVIQNSGGAALSAEDGEGEAVPDVLRGISQGLDELKREVSALGARLEDLEEKRAAPRP